jgi:WD40 repeat protein
MASLSQANGAPSKPRFKSTKKLVPSVTISDTESEVFVVRWSPDGQYIAAGAGDGAIQVFESLTGRLAFNLQQGSAAALPATSLRFRPSNDATRTKNVLVSTNAVGAVQHWHVTSGKCLHTLEEAGNQIFALDYRPDGLEFATAGKDAAVRLYDEATKTLTASLQSGLSGFSGGSQTTPGHSNRIFSVKFHPTDENILISGGWDNTVVTWDKRTGGAVSSIFGPHLCGDSLDLHVNPSTGKTTLLTGSWRPESPLELWELDSGALIEKVEWKESLLASQPCLLYAAQFSKNGVADAGRFIVAGGSGANEARVFDRHAGTMTSHGGSEGAGGTALVGTVTGMSRGVFSADWSPVADKVAIGTGDGTVRILDVADRASTDDDKEGEGGDCAPVVVAPALRAEAKDDDDLKDDDEDKYTQAAGDDE